jgi:hypothetical protein
MDFDGLRRVEQRAGWKHQMLKTHYDGVMKA